jgi:thymidine kinase
LKQATKYTIEIDAPRAIELRFNIVSQWKAAGVDFQRDCVFVDEAGFHSQMMRNRAWSKVGTPAMSNYTIKKA